MGKHMVRIAQEPAHYDSQIEMKTHKTHNEQVCVRAQEHKRTRKQRRRIINKRSL